LRAHHEKPITYMIRFMLTALVLASIGFQGSPVLASDAARLLEDMEAVKPDWLPDLDKCPAEVMPARESKLEYFKERCAAELERCLGNCRAGDAGDCYSSALILQDVRPGPVSEALFSQS